MHKDLQTYVRKQFPVFAARLTPMNFQELAEECGGTIMHDGEKEGNFSRSYIKVLVSFPKDKDQMEARLGDWLVKQGNSWKIYKDRGFRKAFEMRDGTPIPRDN